tara:strand:+ start:19779 stop:21503 length:1725 start_codon:yes stop_codon:yes gene_type:complete
MRYEKVSSEEKQVLTSSQREAVCLVVDKIKKLAALGALKKDLKVEGALKKDLKVEGKKLEALYEDIITSLSQETSEYKKLVTLAESGTKYDNILRKTDDIYRDFITYKEEGGTREDSKKKLESLGINIKEAAKIDTFNNGIDEKIHKNLYKLLESKAFSGNEDGIDLSKIQESFKNTRDNFHLKESYINRFATVAHKFPISSRIAAEVIDTFRLLKSAMPNWLGLIRFPLLPVLTIICAVPRFLYNVTLGNPGFAGLSFRRLDPKYKFMEFSPESTGNAPYPMETLKSVDKETKIIAMGAPVIKRDGEFQISKNFTNHLDIMGEKKFLYICFLEDKPEEIGLINAIIDGTTDKKNFKFMKLPPKEEIEHIVKDMEKAKENLSPHATKAKHFHNVIDNSKKYIIPDELKQVFEEIVNDELRNTEDTATAKALTKINLRLMNEAHKSYQPAEMCSVCKDGIDRGAINMEMFLKAFHDKDTNTHARAIMVAGRPMNKNVQQLNFFGNNEQDRGEELKNLKKGVSGPADQRNSASSQELNSDRSKTTGALTQKVKLMVDRQPKNPQRSMPGPGPTRGQ